jgi:hypothetical protein
VNTLHDWIERVIRELGLDPQLDRDLILDLTREVAHGVARPAAPLTAFLVGLAAGRAGGSPCDVRRIADRVSTMAQQYAAPENGPSRG